MRLYPFADPMADRRLFTLAWLLAGLLLGVLLVGCSAGKPQGPGRIQLSPPELDLGAIPNTGPISCTLEVRNVGQGWLEITGISPSCGCTTAELSSCVIPPGIASAGIILVRSDLRDVVRVFALSRATYRKMVQNLAWATGTTLSPCRWRRGCWPRWDSPSPRLSARC